MPTPRPIRTLLKMRPASTTRCSLTMRRLALLSRFAIAVGPDYRRPPCEGGLLIHVDAAWHSRFYGDLSLSHFMYVRRCDLSNARRRQSLVDGLEMVRWARDPLASEHPKALPSRRKFWLIFGASRDPGTTGVTIRLRRRRRRILSASTAASAATGRDRRGEFGSTDAITASLYPRTEPRPNEPEAERPTDASGRSLSAVRHSGKVIRQIS